MTVVLMLLTAFTDPGVIPSRASLGKKELTKVPFQNWVVTHHLQTVKLKYCAECQIIRPPRTVHCAHCNACILCIDHHCPWIGTCVAANNYHHFKHFILAMTLSIGLSLLAHSVEISYQLTEYKVSL